MKFLLLMLAWLSALVPVASGQGIAMELVLDQEQYLPGESLPIKVRITNFSGRDLTLGKDENWLTFYIEDGHHMVIRAQRSLPVSGEFTLEPSMTGTKKIDLMPFYDLAEIGRYSVRAAVIVSQWNKAIETKPISFDIIRGNAIWEQEFGVPGTTGKENSMPELRRYALVQTRHSNQVRLYFRLTDTSGNRVFRIYLLGPLASFSNPEPQLDKFSNLHVLYQTGPRNFSHMTINPDGLLLTRETFQSAESRPSLRAASDGRISVVGGTRIVSPSDLPPPMPSTNVLPNAKLDSP